MRALRKKELEKKGLKSRALDRKERVGQEQAMAFLEVRNLELNVGGFKLHDIRLRVEEGDYVAVIGPSGSGKSLLLETIIGFYSPKAGRIFLEGCDITAFTPDKRQISIVYQDHVLFPHMTVFENIAYALQKKVKDKARIKAEVERIASLLEISPLLFRRPKTLSGGEKQRTALARGLVVRPKLLLLDEPFSALDVRTKERLRAILKNAIREYSTTVLHVTHDFDDLWALADRVLVIRNGKVMQEGEPEAVFKRPSPNFVAEFLGTNLLKGRVRNREGNFTVLELEEKSLAQASKPELEMESEAKSSLLFYSADSGKPGEVVSLSIRPEDIILAEKALESSARNMLKGKVKVLTKKEHLVSVSLKLESGNKSDLSAISKAAQASPGFKAPACPDSKVSEYSDSKASGIELKAVITPTACELLGLERGKEVYAIFKAANVKIIR
ncbi:MAG: ATP-binding cassette domain-containing protein [Methanosarcinaceae archaeon]|nr:ATP-binding cassette domain-containing protein [Methanosarcinaceae archaeon]